MLALLSFGAISFGFICAAGVFTVLSSVQLVPRFIGKSRSSGDIFLYENMIILGTIIGGIVSIYWEYEGVGTLALGQTQTGNVLGTLLLLVGGIFSGMFVGCLALSIAEMLDSIPIFLKRISWKWGVSLMVASVALGKILGSLIYFGRGF